MRLRMLVATGIVMGMTAGALARGQTGSHQSGMESSNAAAMAQGPAASNSLGRDADADYQALQQHQGGKLGLAGRVVLQDAMLPWDPIPVVVVCNNEVRYRTTTDGKGGFVIQGRVAGDSVIESQITPTPSKSGPVVASQLAGCDASAALAGFKSTSVHISNLNVTDNPDIGTITLRPDGAAAGSAESATGTTVAPDAMKRYEKAREEWQNNNANGAQKDLEKAVQADPKFADAWYQLGKAQQKKGDNAAALTSYQKAAEADPKFVSPYSQIAELEGQQKNWKEAANAAEAALNLDPTGTPQLWYVDALAQFNLGNMNAGEASARKALAMDPQHTVPNTEQLLAVMLAGQGDYAEALKHLQNSLTYVKPGPNADLIKQQIAQLEKAMPQDTNSK